MVIPMDAEGEVLADSADLLQEVEFGRLNLGHSPEAVLEVGYEEAMAAINASSSFSTDAGGRIVLTIDGKTKTIDSARENLALYRQLISKGYLEDVALDVDMGQLDFLTEISGPTDEKLKVAASLLAAASDKGSTCSIDKLIYLNSILGLNAPYYVDFISYPYSRQDTYSKIWAKMLIEAVGTVTIGDLTTRVFYVDEVNIMSYVFNNTDFDSATSGARAFAECVTDATLVITYIQEFAVPEDIEVDAQQNE
jgi:hypothetical protein